MLKTEPCVTVAFFSCQFYIHAHTHYAPGGKVVCLTHSEERGVDNIGHHTAAQAREAAVPPPPPPGQEELAPSSSQLGSGSILDHRTDRLCSPRGAPF